MDEVGHGPVEATVHRYCCGRHRFSFFVGGFLFFGMVVGDLQYIDKLLMCLWLCSDRAGCFQVAYGGCGRTPHISCVLLAPLALGLFFFQRACIWHFPWCTCVSLRLSTSCFAPTQFALGIWTLLSRLLRWLTLFVQFLARQWIHVHVRL